MVSKQINNNWAIALFKVAEQENKVDRFLNQCNILIEIFKNYPDYINIINDFKLSRSLRKLLIKNAFSNNLEVNILNFLYLLIDRNFFSQVYTILKKFRILCNEKKDIIFGVIFSISPLKKAEINALSEKISKKLKLNILLINKIDQSLIAGIKINVLNQIFDGSIKGQLIDMKSQIKKK